LIIFGNNSVNKLVPLLGIAVIILLLVLLKKSLIASRLGNSLFQIVWLYILAAVVNFRSDLIIFFFVTGHLPLFFVRHLNLFSKTLVLLLSVIAGTGASIIFIFLSYPLNLIITIFFHCLFYFIFKPLDQRYHLGIIN